MKGTDKPLEMDIAIDVQYRQGKVGKYGNVNLGYVVHGLGMDNEKDLQNVKNEICY